MTAMVRKERDPDLEVAGAGHGPPRHPARAGAIFEFDRQERGVLADEPVVAPAAFDAPDLVDAEAEPLVLARRLRIPQQPDKVGEVVFLDRPKTYLVTHGASLAHQAFRNAG
jgi:hypothetical protein